MQGEPTEPLLYFDLEKEILILNHDYGLFKVQADELEKDLQLLERKQGNKEKDISNL
jgi:hypothetical protein